MSSRRREKSTSTNHKLKIVWEGNEAKSKVKRKQLGHPEESHASEVNNLKTIATFVAELIAEASEELSATASIKDLIFHDCKYMFPEQDASCARDLLWADQTFEQSYRGFSLLPKCHLEGFEPSNTRFVEHIRLAASARFGNPFAQHRLAELLFLFPESTELHDAQSKLFAQALATMRKTQQQMDARKSLPHPVMLLYWDRIRRYERDLKADAMKLIKLCPESNIASFILGDELDSDVVTSMLYRVRSAKTARDLSQLIEKSPEACMSLLAFFEQRQAHKNYEKLAIYACKKHDLRYPLQTLIEKYQERADPDAAQGLIDVLLAKGDINVPYYTLKQHSLRQEKLPEAVIDAAIDNLPAHDSAVKALLPKMYRRKLPEHPMLSFAKYLVLVANPDSTHEQLRNYGL